MDPSQAMWIILQYQWIEQQMWDVKEYKGKK